MATAIEPSYILSMTNKFNTIVTEHILDIFSNEHITVSKDDSNYPKAMNISGLSPSTVISHCVTSQNVAALKQLELWEFTCDYPYSVLYKIDELNEKQFKNKIEQLGLKQFDIASNEFDDLHHVIEHPVILEQDDLILFKFPLSFTAMHPTSGERLYLKYPIIGVVYCKEKVLEVRFNEISSLYLSKKSKDFYSENVRSVRAWFVSKFNLSISNFLLEEKVNNISNGSSIITAGKYMCFSDGGRACLELGKSDTLPLLDELKNIIAANREEFEKPEAKVITGLLNTFISQKEEQADNKWISLCWKGERKIDDIKVKFTFDYIDSDVCLLFHYSGPIGMERMNHVTRCIISN